MHSVPLLGMKSFADAPQVSLAGSALIVTVSRMLHPEKAFAAIDVTEAGRVISLTLEQP